MTPTDRLNNATTRLKAKARLWAGSQAGPQRIYASKELLEAARAYGEELSRFRSWINGLPPPREAKKKSQAAL